MEHQNPNEYKKEIMIKLKKIHAFHRYAQHYTLPYYNLIQRRTKRRLIKLKSVIVKNAVLSVCVLISEIFTTTNSFVWLDILFNNYNFAYSWIYLQKSNMIHLNIFSMFISQYLRFLHFILCCSYLIIHILIINFLQTTKS